MALTKYEQDLHLRHHLTYDDECYYFIESTNGSFMESEQNQLVFNFKRPISFIENEKAWYYRNQAIDKFVDFLSEIQAFRKYPFTVIPAPTSKRRYSELFNNRIEKTVELLANKFPNLIVEHVFDSLNDVQEAHNGGSRNIDDIRNNIHWNGFVNNPSKYVFLIDDVLTTGAHFRVWKDMINYYYPDIQVIGIFLALYTWRNIIELPDISFL